MKLIPNFWRASGVVVAGCLAVTFGAYLFQGYGEGNWWSSNYAATLSIPTILMPIFVWFAFVPNRLEVTDRTIFIGFRFRVGHTLYWEDLNSWELGEGVFMMRFANHKTFPIFSGAYSSDQWSWFRNFLVLRFPERRARIWFGPWPYRWRR